MPHRKFQFELPAWEKVRSLDWLYDPKTRGIIFQLLLMLALGLLGYQIVSNTITNLQKQNLASGFGFLSKTSGFDISPSGNIARDN